MALHESGDIHAGCFDCKRLDKLPMFTAVQCIEIYTFYSFIFSDTTAAIITSSEEELN
jgi:hypothetical protein